MTESGPAESAWIQEGMATENPYISFYGHGASLEDYRRVSENVLNLVTTVPGLAAAKELKKRFGTEYRVQHPAAERLLRNAWEKLPEEDRKRAGQEIAQGTPAAADIGAFFDSVKPQRVLIVQEQVLGNSLRAAIAASASNNPEIHVMSFFKMLPEWMEAGDRFLSEESELWGLLHPEQSSAQNAEAIPQCAGYDLILGDAVLKKMLPPDFEGCFLEIPESAISGFPMMTDGGQDE